MPDDFAHLLYGCARLAWLERGVFPVHAACIGNDVSGYALLVGASGSGKTSVSLQGVLHNNLLCYSGDKTLVKIEPNGELHAIAGTKVASIRDKDQALWSNLIPPSKIEYSNRVIFSLDKTLQSARLTVAIKSIVMLKLCDYDHPISPINFPMSLHLLYPLFMDKAREDITIAHGKSVFDGALSHSTKQQLTHVLSQGLAQVSTQQMWAQREKIASELARQLLPAPLLKPVTLKTKNILMGVCGIGNGHISREIPILNHLLQMNHQIIMFSFGTSYDYFTKYYPDLRVVRTGNPYYLADKQGLNFRASSAHTANKHNIFQLNCNAMAYVKEQFSTLDAVISDYEPTSAQYGYSQHAPIITIDQQSKYLLNGFTEVNNTSCQDEIERLSLFFPKATRFATSFFSIKQPLVKKKVSTHDVRLFPPILRKSIVDSINCQKTKTASIVVYMTAWQDKALSLDNIYSILQAKKAVDFHIFLPKKILDLPHSSQNLNFYHHGDARFDSLFASCHGIISTAGHSLLSEAMHLGKPVYATPINVYEQEMNAKAISDNGFGIQDATITAKGLTKFLNNLSVFAQNIKEDNEALLRGPGNQLITDAIDELLNNPAASFC